MSDEALALEQALREVGWVDRWEAEGEARGRTEGQLEVLALLRSGKTIEEAEHILGLTQ